MGLYLRRANDLDKKKIWEWANEEETRKNSFHTERISWQEHEVWYDNILNSDKEALFVCMDFMKPVGNIYVDWTKEEKAYISYNVDPEYRESGYEQQMLALMEQEMRGKLGENSCFYAEVKAGNEASVHVFEKAGYERVREETITQSEKELFCYQKGISKKMSAQKTPQVKLASFEVLRVLAMIMIVTAHYMEKGGLLHSLIQDKSASNFLFWILENMCVVSVNIYVLISGYFLVDKRFKLSKAVDLWCRVFFYSVVVAAVMLFSGAVPPEHFTNLYQLQFYLLPILNGHYWFVTAYVLMYLFSPLLGRAVRCISKRELQTVIMVLLILMCFVKTIIPVPLATDEFGNHYGWFLCLFLIAAYIRIYGIPFFKNGKVAFGVYIFSVLGSLLYHFMAAVLVEQAGKYEHLLKLPQHHNFIFVLTGALGLFYVFKHWNMKGNWFTRYLVKLAPYTLGVYLLHEHLLVRYLWIDWLKVSSEYGGFRILHMILSVILVMGIGILADYLRHWFFVFAQKLIVIALRIYYAKREAWDYLIFGALATVVNWAVYLAFAYCFLKPIVIMPETTRELVANLIAWVVAVLFAYWTNRNFVFRSQIKDFVGIMKEFTSFIGARIFSFVVEQVLFYMMVDRLLINDLISKLVISVVVIILNYIFSKMWIFGKKTSA